MRPWKGLMWAGVVVCGVVGLPAGCGRGPGGRSRAGSSGARAGRESGRAAAPRGAVGQPRGGAHLAEIVPGADVLSVAGLRAKVSEQGTLSFAGVVVSTPERGIRCLETQAEHHRSCPPPYHTVGDAPPFSGRIPPVLGPRVLVELDGSEALKVGRMYVFEGRWCFDRDLAKFCGRVVGRVADGPARSFWEAHGAKYVRRRAPHGRDGARSTPARGGSS